MKKLFGLLVQTGNHLVVYLLAGSEQVTLKNTLLFGADSI